MAFFIVTDVLLAATWTAPTQNPPQNNAPGYIFNFEGAAGSQALGSFSISGNGTMGSLTVSGTSATVNGQAVCLADGTSCLPTASYWTQSGTSLYPNNTAWNLGIGLSSLAGSKLQIVNNVGSGNIDQYGEYQVLLYNSGTASGSYGIGIQPSTMVFNSGSSYKFFRGGSVVDLSLINGNLGIRETAPGYPLHVDDDSNTAIVNLDNDGPNVWTGIRLERDVPLNNEKWFIGMGGAFSGLGDKLVMRHNGVSNDLVIDPANGNVGIGTANPAEQLDVAGGQGGLNGGIIRLGSRVNTPSVVTDRLYNERGTLYWNGAMVVNPGGNVGGLGAADYIPKWISPTTIGNSLLYQNLSKLGFGTTNPATTFEVGDLGGTAQVRITDTGQNPELQLQYGAGANDHWGMYVNQTADDFRIWGNGSDRLTILQNGNVGINTAGLKAAPGTGPTGGNGARLVLATNGLSYPYSIGVDSSPASIWYSVPDGASHQWYISGSNRMWLTRDWLIVSPVLWLQPDDFPGGAPPTPGNGMIYYDGTLNKFRCYENGAWKDCDTTGSGGDNLGNHIATQNLNMNNFEIYGVKYLDIQAPGNGIRFWSSDAYAINMGSGAEFQYGPVTGYSIKMNMNSDSTRGWTWGVDNTAPVAAINTQGNMRLSGEMRASWVHSTAAGDNTFVGNVGIGTMSPGAKLEIAGQVKITGGSPSAGKVLTSDAAGLASWQTVSGGLPVGSSGQTLRHNGSSWIANSVIFNDGTNVGIGTASPAARLEVNDSSAAAATVRITDTVQNPGIELQYGSNGSNHWSIFSDQSNNDSLTIPSTAGSGRLVIAPSGYVGIGTITTPSANLEIRRDVASSASMLKLTEDNSSGDAAMTFTTVNGNLFVLGLDRSDGNKFKITNGGTLGQSNADRLVFDTASNRVTIGAPSSARVDINGALKLVPSTAPTAENGTMYYDSSSNKFRCYENGAWKDCIAAGSGGLPAGTSGQTLRHNGSSWIANSVIFNDGTNVGIGTAAPAEPLDVNIGRVRLGQTSAPTLTANKLYNIGGNLWWAGARLNAAGGVVGGSGQVNYVPKWTAQGSTLTNSIIYDNSTNVGIGTVNPGAKLEVAGQVKITGGGPGAGKVLTSDGAGLASWQTVSGGLPAGTSGQTLRHNGSSWIANSTIYNNGTNVGIGTSNPGIYKLNVNGNMYVNGRIYCFVGGCGLSDVRLKKNVEPFVGALEKIKNIDSVTFEWDQASYPDKNFPGGRQYGLIAQQVEQEFPELVTEDPEGFKHVEYDNFTAVLLQALKEQQAEIDQLKALVGATVTLPADRGARVAELEAQLAELRAEAGEGGQVNPAPNNQNQSGTAVDNVIVKLNWWQRFADWWADVL